MLIFALGAPAIKRYYFWVNIWLILFFISMYFYIVVFDSDKTIVNDFYIISMIEITRSCYMIIHKISNNMIWFIILLHLMGNIWMIKFCMVSFTCISMRHIIPVLVSSLYMCYFFIYSCVHITVIILLSSPAQYNILTRFVENQIIYHYDDYDHYYDDYNNNHHIKSINTQKIYTMVTVDPPHVCAICLEQDKNMVSLKCNHMFHKKCINDLINNNIIFCPLCRSKFIN
uniref:RING-type domain-containing protein n=1 Tax=Megaviridae environmental sample TaxID=1737588 RepID=A0A5J6VKW3_9VIRU|nr:MAG: hypothetical protein [Megaviridae environmental sample]